MKYDDASWHYGGDFPQDLPAEAGGTHIGMFLTWSLLNGLDGSIWADEFPQDIPRLVKKEVTPGQFFMNFADEKFVDEMLNDEGNAFAEAYYNVSYLDDYESVLAANLPTCYHVADSWANYDRLSPMIASRFDLWKRGELKDEAAINIDFEKVLNKPWWKFW